MMHLFLNLTSNQMDKIYLLIYRSASHLFPAKVSVPFQVKKEKKRKPYQRMMVLTVPIGASMGSIIRV